MNALIVLAVLLVAICCEAKLAHKGIMKQTLRQSYKTNTATFVFNSVVLSLLSVSSLSLVASNFSQFGVLNFMSPTGKAIMSFVLLDLTLYFWHRANHTFDWLWMFHKAHHSDLSMNVTTALRVHMMEAFLTTAVKSIFIVAAGVGATMVLVNELIITLFFIFHHSNLSFSGERLLGWLIVVPSLHRVHHSTVRAEHDNNYGAAFSFWDRLFGTLVQTIPDQIGLKDVPAQGFVQLFLSGFTRHSDQKPADKKDCFFCHFFGKA